MTQKIETHMFIIIIFLSSMLVNSLLCLTIRKKKLLKYFTCANIANFGDINIAHIKVVKLYSLCKK